MHENIQLEWENAEKERQRVDDAVQRANDAVKRAAELEAEVKRLQTFADYTNKYNASDPKIRLKIDHTYRVAALAERIARTVTDIPIDRDLAWTMGMLHDIGRFEQVKRYGTFVDSESVDHAELGITILFEEGLLTQFGDFTPEEQELLKVSIENHNKYRIPQGMSAEKTAYCNILRDADKIDIFRVNCDTPLEDIYNVSTAELKQAAVSDLVKKCFVEKHTVLRSLKHTPVDNLVGHVCLVFELVYPISVQIAKEQGYVDKLMQFVSDNPDTNAWLSHMRKHLWSS